MVSQLIDVVKMNIFKSSKPDKVPSESDLIDLLTGFPVINFQKNNVTFEEPLNADEKEDEKADEQTDEKAEEKAEEQTDEKEDVKADDWFFVKWFRYKSLKDRAIELNTTPLEILKLDELKSINRTLKLLACGIVVVLLTTSRVSKQYSPSDPISRSML